MKNFLKKITNLLVVLFILGTFNFSFADTHPTDDRSDYIFYIEFIQNKPQVSTDEKFPYYIVPVIEHAQTLTSGEYRGEIISGKGVILTTFWFNTPTTTIAALNKSRVDIRAPYFANANRVNFYKGTASKALFFISLSASSFCNDNNKCEKDIGEDYFNCTNDCPAPAGTNSPTTGTSEEVPLTAPVVTPTTEPSPVLTGTNEGTTTRTGSSGLSDKSSVVQLTVGIFLVLLSFVGYIAWKRHTRSEGFE